MCRINVFFRSVVQFNYFFFFKKYNEYFYFLLRLCYKIVKNLLKHGHFYWLFCQSSQDFALERVAKPDSAS